MEILINELINKGRIDIDDTISFTDLGNTAIKKLDDINIKGYIKCNLSEEIEVVLQVEGEMYLEDSITLELIAYPFSFEINEIIEENAEESTKYFKNNKNTLDIIEILWENIVLEVPISYTKKQGANLKGDGWELNGANGDFDDNPFAKLNDLFKGGE